MTNWYAHERVTQQRVMDYRREHDQIRALRAAKVRTSAANAATSRVAKPVVAQAMSWLLVSLSRALR